MRLAACQRAIDIEVVSQAACDHDDVTSGSGDREHRHGIDKYLDTSLANQPISDGKATDHCQKVASQDGGLPELIVTRSCLTNHSEASRP